MIFPPADDSNAVRLRHIVLTLLALGVFAERAALCPLPVRLYLFDILRRAEYAAVALFINIDDCFSAGALWSACLPGDEDAGHSALIRLADSLRAMAAMLAATGLPATPALACNTPAIRVGDHPWRAPFALPVHRAHDTS